MNEIFADAGYWIAILIPGDQHRTAANNLTDTVAESQIVTTQMVLAEVFAAVSRQGAYVRGLAMDLLNRLSTHPKVTIIPQTSVQFEAAARYFAQRPDQRYSLTDCASFLVMEERGIERALTFDTDFRSAGFTPLMA